MNQDHWKPRKVVIVGAGAVGSTFAYTLAQSGLADEIGLLDANAELAKGQVLDLAHGQTFFPSVQIREARETDYADAHLIVITAGSKQRPGESRLALLQRNAKIIQDIMDDIVRQKSPAIVLVVSNPVDILTYVAHQRSGWPRGRVLGSGTVLDSARFRHLLSQHCGVDVHNVHAYILGEHGDSEVAAWSMTHMAGMPVEQYCAVCKKCDDWAKVPARNCRGRQEFRLSHHRLQGSHLVCRRPGADAHRGGNPAQSKQRAHGFGGVGRRIRLERSESGGALPCFAERH